MASDWTGTVSNSTRRVRPGDYDVTDEHVGQILKTTISLGSYLNRLIEHTDKARVLGLFDAGDAGFSEFFETIKPGETKRLFNGFILGKKHDGSVFCSADEYLHGRFNELFDWIMKGVPRLFEENTPEENAKAHELLLKSPKNSPVISLDEVDNTLGLILRLFNTPYHDAHQFSINLAISPRNEKQGFGSIYLPLTQTLYYTHEGKVYTITDAESKAYEKRNWEPKLDSTEIQLDLTIPETIRVVTSHSALDPRKTPEQQAAARERDKALAASVTEATSQQCELLHATGICRLALLFEGKADLAVSSAGMYWWDVRGGFEICNALGLSVAVRQEDRDAMPRFPNNQPLPQLICGKQELLVAMGYHIVYGKGAEIDNAHSKSVAESSAPSALLHH